MKSKDIDLSKLSDETGISVDDLKRIIDGTYRAQDPYFLRGNQRTVIDQLQEATQGSSYKAPAQDHHPVQEEVYEDEPAQTTLQEIADADNASDLFDILEQLDYTDAEYIVAYEKLVRMVSKETDATNDLDDLRELLKSAPTGSSEETRLVSKIKTLERNAIDSEKNFNDLIGLYQDAEFYTESKRYAADKLITISTTPDHTKELIDDIFPDESLEYYQVQKKHKELIQRAIATLRKDDDPDELGESIDKESDELLYLAQQLVALGARDPQAIWDHEQLFPDNSEALEILAAGALAQCNKHSDSIIEILDSISESFDSSSRIGRQVTKRRQSLLREYFNTEKDLEILNEHLESLDAGDPLKKELEERIVYYTTDKDDLKALLDTDTHMGMLAQRKLTELIQKERSNARKADDLSGLEEYVESGSTEEDLLDLRFVQLFKDADEANNYRIADGSFAMYQLALRFGPKSNSASSTSKPEPVVQAPVVETPAAETIDALEQEKEQERLRILGIELNRIRLEDEETKRKIAKCGNVADAMKLFGTFPGNSEYRTIAYKRASGLLDSELYNIRRQADCEVFLKLFPQKSAEWTMVVKKLASYYPRPWYKFW